MAPYYIIGIALVIWALTLTAMGVTRESFPPTEGGGRALMAVSASLVLGTVVAILVTSEREHPREEAKAKAAEKAEAERAPAGKPKGKAASLEVVEKEYSVKLRGGKALDAGDYTVEVSNAGKIQHDLAVEGAGTEKKTPLIDAGKQAKLEVDLKRGRYKLYCTVPGHEQLGMKTQVTVR